ncbi:MAG TPA: SRPBCC family protein [Solirubrobacter sp.]|nr:SRPBCC family protein [Solirubrobacter sp.]
MIDVDHQINAAERRVGGRTLAAGEARTLTVARVYPTTLEDLWDACTNPERIPRWFLPVSGDLELGGRYQLQGNASGTIQTCEPPRAFSATWEFGGDTTWIELQLTPEADGTRFTLEHIAHIDDERALQYGPGAVGVGWDLALIGLTLHLANGGEPVDPAAFAQWSASDAGRDFITRVSEAWGEASIAAGANADEARAAAARTTAFYTGG